MFNQKATTTTTKITKSGFVSLYLQKKKKVIQTPAEDNSFVEDVDNDFNDLSLIDIDFPSASYENNSGHEQSFEVVKTEEERISEEIQDILDKSQNESQNKENGGKEEAIQEATAVSNGEDLKEEFVEPSAPVIDLEPSTSSTAAVQHIHFSPEKVSYPDLESVRNLTEQLTSVPKTIQLEDTKLKPFTETQMQQLYSNAQLKEIEKFEIEFITKELKENQKQTDHILYQLLRKYARSRTNLKTNLCSINTLKRDCNNNYKKIWSIERKFVYRSGSCDKGHSVKVMHKFE